MLSKLHDISGEVLLAFGGALIFFCFGTTFVIAQLASVHSVDTLPPLPEVPDVLADKTLFEIGQYYFNHDDDPNGPYDIEKAQVFFEREIALNPQKHNLVYYQSGRIDFINGDFDRALEKFQKQVAYFGDEVPNVYYMIGLTYGFKARIMHHDADWKKAEEAFETFISYVPEAAWPRVDLAWVYFSQGKFEQMKPVLEQGMWYESNNPWLLNMYGLALYNTNDPMMAREYFLFAQELANELTVEDWGRSYPGNNPQLWGSGLAEFRGIIQKNIDLTNNINNAHTLD